MNSEPEKQGLYERIRSTITGLYHQPDEIVDHYTEGTRGVYMNPYLYVVLTALVLAFVTSFVISYPEMEATPADPEQIEQLEQELQGFRTQELQDVMQVVGVIMNTQYIGFLNILLFPILALSGMFFFRESYPGFFRHLVLNSYAVGQANIALLLLVPVWVLFQNQLFEPGIYLYPTTFLIGLVLLMTYNRYFGLTTLTEWLRASSSLIVGYFLYSVISGFVIAMISFIVYMGIAISQF